MWSNKKRNPQLELIPHPSPRFKWTHKSGQAFIGLLTYNNRAYTHTSSGILTALGVLLRTTVTSWGSHTEFPIPARGGASVLQFPLHRSANWGEQAARIYMYNPRQSMWQKEDQSLLPSSGLFSREKSFFSCQHANQALSTSRRPVIWAAC